jgi:hypothetical protein
MDDRNSYWLVSAQRAPLIFTASCGPGVVAAPVSDHAAVSDAVHPRVVLAIVVNPAKNGWEAGFGGPLRVRS